MDKVTNKTQKAMFLRWLYMVSAIMVSAVLFQSSVFSFQDDKGIIYIRSFSMDERMFYVTQTDMSTHAEEVTATMSVKGLYYCNWAMLITCVACFLCFFSDRWRMFLCILAAFLAGAYYILLIYYAMAITENHYATLTPNLWVVLPAVVLQLMLLVRRSVAREQINDNEDEEREEDPA